MSKGIVFYFEPYYLSENGVNIEIDPSIQPHELDDTRSNIRTILGNYISNKIKKKGNYEIFNDIGIINNYLASSLSIKTGHNAFFLNSELDRKYKTTRDVLSNKNNYALDEDNSFLTEAGIVNIRNTNPKYTIGKALDVITIDNFQSSNNIEDYVDIFVSDVIILPIPTIKDDRALETAVDISAPPPLFDSRNNTVTSSLPVNLIKIVMKKGFGNYIRENVINVSPRIARHNLINDLYKIARTKISFDVLSKSDLLYNKLDNFN